MLSYERFKDIDTYESESHLFDTNTLNVIASKVLPINDLNSPASQAIFELSKSKKIVCIGEASHGSKEFYEYRNSITMKSERFHMEI